MKHSLLAIQALFLLGVSALAEDGKIVGGEEAAPHSIPWQVKIKLILNTCLGPEGLV